MFLNKNTPEQVAIFNDILMDVFSNYTPNKYVTIGDRDPPWMTEKIKNKINLKRCLSKSNIFITIVININFYIDIGKERKIPSWSIYETQ